MYTPLCMKLRLDYDGRFGKKTKELWSFDPVDLGGSSGVLDENDLRTLYSSCSILLD